MKSLFLVHLEESFYAQGFISNELINKVKKKILWADEIYIFESEIDRDGVFLGELMDYICKKNKSYTKINWAWGYEPECFLDDELEFCIPSRGAHEWTWIPPELRNKKQSDFGKIIVSGGANGECLEDFKVILENLDLKFECPYELRY